MRQLLACTAAVALMAAAAAPAARADEQSLMAHYDAYDKAMKAVDYAKADTEGEAAWREAEKVWGPGEDTGVLAFNVVRIRLLLDRRAQAAEPAARVAELVEKGALKAVTPAEAALFTRLASFDAATADKKAARALAEALEAYPVGDFASTRIAWLGWTYVAGAYKERKDWDEALSASVRALDLMDKDTIATPQMKASVAIVAADSSYGADKVEQGLDAVYRVIAAYPPQPAAQPLDPVLASLLIWQRALGGVYAMKDFKPGSPPKVYMPKSPALADPAWDNDRYAASHGCPPAPQWEVAEAPKGGPGGGPGGGMGMMMGGPPQPGAGIGAVFEYYLTADGAVDRVDVKGAEPGKHPYEAVLRGRHAKAPGASCLGPYLDVQAFLMPKMDQTQGTIRSFKR